jgi:hypothetical protein
MFLSFHPLSLESIVSPSVLAHFESRLLGSVGVFGFGWTRAAYIVTHGVTEIVIISGWDVSRSYTTHCFKSCPPKMVSSYCVLDWYGVDSQYANPLQLSPKKTSKKSLTTNTEHTTGGITVGDAYSFLPQCYISY